MRIVGCMLFSLMMCEALSAQTSKTITVKDGSDVKLVLSKEIYAFPEFVDGIVTFKNGVKGSSRLNYNLLIGEMQFISPTGDTLAVANEKTIEDIAIANRVFYYDKVYLELIKEYPSVKLAMKQRLKLIDKHKIGAYGQASGASAIDQYQSFSDGVRIHQLNVREDMLFSKETTYYLADKFNHFVRPNKKNLLNMFSTIEKPLENYLKENAVDFNDEEDLKKLVNFINSIPE